MCLIILRGGCCTGCSLVSFLVSEWPSLLEGTKMAFTLRVLRSWLVLSTAVFPQLELTEFIFTLCVLAAKIIKSEKKNYA